MIENIQVIYKNGVFRPLKPLDLPEDEIFNMDLRDVVENGAETHQNKVSRVLREAGLTSPLNLSVTEKDILSEEERQRLGKLFSGEKPIGDYVDEDREVRG